MNKSKCICGNELKDYEHICVDCKVELKEQLDGNMVEINKMLLEMGIEEVEVL